MSFETYAVGYPVTFFIMLISSVLTGTLAAKLKMHAKLSSQIAFRTQVLFDTDRLLQKAKQIFVILRDMELIPDMEIYREVFFILRNETLNGRHVCELLEDMCKTEEMIPDMERAEQIFSYRDYPYMKKRWEKFCRHSAIAGTETLKWEEEMECFHHFLGDMWEAVCRDEVFFGDWMPELARFLG